MTNRLFGVLIAVAACLPTSANAQAISTGIDGGFTFSDPQIELLDPTATRDNVTPTVGLGIDAAFYWLASEELAIGGTLSPMFFGAGQQPSFGINFFMGPRFVWRPQWFHLATEVGFVLSAFDDRCSGELTGLDDCPRTRQATGAAPGFGVGVAPLFRIGTWEDMDFLVGPAVRYQWAHYRYGDGSDGGFALQLWQAVLTLRVFAELLE